jgi:hypothetical protein
MQVHVDQFGPAPRDDWSCYPGHRPEFSYILCDEHVRRVEHDQFDAVLHDLGTETLEERHPVIAYGSNACPAQLAHKYRSTGRTHVIPMSRARIDGVAIGYSDHLTMYGAVPAKAFAVPGVQTEVFVSWLDPEQLSRLDRSEGHNYRRQSLDRDRYPLRIVDGPLLQCADIYYSTHALFTVDDVAPGMAGVQTTYVAGPSLTQVEVRELRAATSVNP